MDRFVIVEWVGFLLLAGLVFEVLVGKRVIKLKGPMHQRVHRWVAYTAIGIGVMHAAIALGWVPLPV